MSDKTQRELKMACCINLKVYGIISEHLHLLHEHSGRHRIHVQRYVGKVWDLQRLSLRPCRPLRELRGPPSRRMRHPERLRERPLRPRAGGLHLRLLRRLRVRPEQDGLHRWAGGDGQIALVCFRSSEGTPDRAAACLHILSPLEPSQCGNSQLEGFEFPYERIK